MEFRILGPLEVLNDGVPLDLGPLKQRSLLALLVLRPNRVVSTDQILEEIWGDGAAGKENALWVYVSRLRAALEPDRDDRRHSSVLLTRDHGYVLSVDPGLIDAQRFEAAVDEGRSLVRSDPGRAAEILGEALALWRGPALQDFAYEEFARADSARLEELRLNAVEDRVEADLRRGLTSELVGELETFVVVHPLRERPVGQLMLALYRAGRQAEALRAFERFRRGLGEELGIEPSPELRRLEEQILLHDSRLQPLLSDGRVVTTAPGQVVNPFKGLFAFGEADADDFFGRERLVADVLARLAQETRLIALVGPSGSGKSSVVRAGVIPALRRGALPGSERWLIATMVPGAHPMVELEAALLHATVDPPSSLSEQLEGDGTGLLRAALRILPDDSGRLVLVIDQFEELFTLVDDIDVCRRFLSNLETALDDPHGRVLVVLTLRADAYHRPLAHSSFATRLNQAVVNVVALTPDELEAAAQEPLAHMGISVQPALLAELLRDVIGEPGALPIFQYALTELFDRRAGNSLTVDAYRSMGGVRGALGRRADEVFAQLDEQQQQAARQLFLRLVTITEDDQWSRRRVHASEIVALDVDVVAMEAAIDSFGRQRFLAFDREPASGAPTVEVAHEALLWEWGALRSWIEESREDVRRETALRASMDEWLHAGRDADYLLTGSRLAEYEQWSDTTSMRLTTTEHDYLVAASDHRAAVQVEDDRRRAGENKLRRRARRRLWALVAVIAAVIVTVAGVAVGLVLTREDAPRRVALVYPGRTAKGPAALAAAGFDQAQDELNIEAEEVTPPFSDLPTQLHELATAGTDLVIVGGQSYIPAAMEAAAQSPGTTWAYFDVPVEGAPSWVFADQQGAYLMGAAAALTSQSGTIGFVGAFQTDVVERFRAGYEAGARAVRPDVKILAAYVSLGGDGFSRDDLAQATAERMYASGADVVFHAAGTAGYGVFDAARGQSVAQGKQLWAIGADSDQYLDVDPRFQRYVLTSMIKKYDVAVRTLIEDFLHGNLEPVTKTLTLADGALDYSTTGGYLTPEVVAVLDSIKHDIIAGRTVVPMSPTGELEPPLGVSATTNTTLTFDGATCRYDGPTTPRSGDVIAVQFVNGTDTDAFGDAVIDTFPGNLGVVIPAPSHEMNTGYLQIAAEHKYLVGCGPVGGAPILAATLSPAPG